MERKKLNEFPVELLEYIVDHLYNDHRPALFMLSLVNKKLRKIACQCLFKTINFEGDVVPELVDAPRIIRDNIQTLNINGCAPRIIRTLGADGKWTKTLFKGGGGSWEEAAWFPLANFLSTLPMLRIMKFDAKVHHFPSCLIDVLDSKSPSVKLHVRNPRFPTHCSLNSFALSEVNIRLLRSSCLKAAVVGVSGGGYNPQAPSQGGISELDSIKRLAPGLESICLVVESSRWPTVFKPFDYETPLQRSSSGRNELSSQVPVMALHVTGSKLLSASFYKFVGENINFDQLLTLRLSNPVDRYCLRFLASGRCFPSLKILKLELKENGRPSEMIRSQDYMLQKVANDKKYYAALQTFLRSLPTLSELKLHGYYSPACWKTAVHRHGSSLRKLSLRPARYLGRFVQIWSLDIDTIVKYCPKLEGLKIMTRRSKGDFDEICIYQNLGKLLHLKRLSLTLDTAWYINLRSNRHDWADEGDWSKALVNCALDEVLARSIFRVITKSRKRESQRKFGVDGSIPLQILRVEVAGPLQGWFLAAPQFHDLGRVIKYIGRCWRLRWNTNTDTPDELIADGPSNSDYEAPETLDVHSELGFRQVWPDHKSASCRWKDDWFSLPLPEYPEQTLESSKKYIM